MALGGIAALSDLAGREAGVALGIGIGMPLSAALEPEAVAIRQELWSADPNAALIFELAAMIAAKGIRDQGWGESEAAQYGVNGERFGALVEAMRTAPGTGELLRALRRKAIGESEVTAGLRLHALDPRFDAALLALAAERLEPAEIAKAIHRGIMRAPGLLVAEPPLTPGRVPIVPPSALDPITEAQAAGLDEERLRILVGNAGLPPGAIQGLELLNRGAITEDDFLRLVAESNMRNEWGVALLALRRRLLTPNEYAEAQLRGFISAGERDAGAALVGMEPADAELLFEIKGRPIPVRAITTGLARGGEYGGTYDDVPEPYRDAIRRSNIRPEWARLAYANRYSMPSAFVIRSMAQAGELTRDETETILLEIGWPPELAAKIAARWAGGAGGKGKAETVAELEDEYAGGFVTEQELRDALGTLGYAGAELDLLVSLNDARRAKRWREKIIDAIAATYLAHRIDATAASSELAEAGVTGEASTMLLRLWDMQRRDTITLLTPAQIVKAHKAGIIDQATALAELTDREYTAQDAATLLAE